MRNPPNVNRSIAAQCDPRQTIAGDHPFGKEHSVTHYLARQYLALKSWYERRRNRRILLALSDDQLKDIGISRSDVLDYDDKS
ncbi:DUF1127 domain-containing protein [Sodalis sp. RH21]|uniref:DUF1127 domain-containing protein n=1 Tax=unclassified Sodalis (in: enterobacteria) TaxID=2636512 RepID=UPI0039B47384